jgi:hypothetical protein
MRLRSRGALVTGAQALEAGRLVEQLYSFDCMTACLATIFGCPYEDAPMLADPTTEQYTDVSDEQLEEALIRSLRLSRGQGGMAADPRRELYPARMPTQ